MSVLRRRLPPENHTNKPHQAPTTHTNASRNRLIYLLLLIPLLYLPTLLPPKPRTSPSTPLLNFTIPPDEETLLSTHRLPLEDHTPVNFLESAIICMPTVQRKGVEYLTNSIKSFRIATRESTEIRTLVVYTMDHPSVAPIWLGQIFDEPVSRSQLPSWLIVEPRVGAVVRPRKATLGDSWERMLWRSKEAMDYAEVLERCAQRAKSRFVIVVQDDVLFRRGLVDVVKWADEHIRDGARVINGARVMRVCAAALFDIAEGEVADGDALRSSNMVARVWKTADVGGWVRFFRDRFDDAPVDWLADRRCRTRRGWVTVMWPNPVRHRGKVSSFANNQRHGLLT